MSKIRISLIQVSPDYQIKRGAVNTESGLSVKKIATAIYDTAGNDSAGASNKAIGAHGLGVYIPNGAIITKAWYQVKTSFADGASNNATIAISANGANDIVSAIAISDSSTPWAAGLHAAIEDGTVTNAVQCTAERQLTATVAVHALTAGKLALFVEYVLAL